MYVYIYIMYTHSVGFSKEAINGEAKERERESKAGRKEGRK